MRAFWAGACDVPLEAWRGLGLFVAIDQEDRHSPMAKKEADMSFSRDSSWICQFPISLAVEGEACYEQMARAGMGRLLFCTVIYSPYRLVLPRYPQKGIYSMEEGKYHYLPEKERYRDLPVAPTPSLPSARPDRQIP